MGGATRLFHTVIHKENENVQNEIERKRIKENNDIVKYSLHVVESNFTNNMKNNTEYKRNINKFTVGFCCLQLSLY